MHKDCSTSCLILYFACAEYPLKTLWSPQYCSAWPLTSKQCVEECAFFFYFQCVYCMCVLHNIL